MEVCMTTSNRCVNWIVNCVNDYFSFLSREFQNEELKLKLGIYRNTDSDYYIELKHNDKISILTGHEKLSKGQMIDLLEHSFIKDFKDPNIRDIDKIYNFIKDSVYSFTGTHKQTFQDKDLDIKIDLYNHTLTRATFDYWLTANGKDNKIYLSNKCLSPKDLVDKIFSSYINDFLVYDPKLNNPKVCIDILKDNYHTLQLELEDKQNQIYKLEDQNSYLDEMVSDLKRINTSIITDNNNKTKENYRLRSEVKELEEELQEEKDAHTTTKCRAIFAKHVLNGDRDERVKDFRIE
jgi:hypothetical protein